MDDRARIQSCDVLLRAGRISEAARLLRQTNLRKVEEETRLPLAKLARRTGLPTLGARLLAPRIVDALQTRRYDGFEREIAEYAVLLQRLGVVEEARSHLLRLDASIVPEVNLYLAFDSVARWDYAGSLPYLERYLASPLDPYAQLIGKLNLAAAYVIERRSDEARTLLTELHREFVSAGHARLTANACQLLAELSLYNDDLPEAERRLREARSLLGEGRVHDQLFIHKWEALLEARRRGDTEPLKNFRRAAAAARDWESVREADLLMVKLAPNESMIHRLYAGTPYPHYRARILRELELTDPPSLRLHLGGTRGPQLDLRLGQIRGEGIPPALHRCFCALTQDQYRPRPVGALFAEIYRGEYFDIFTSPARVYQLVRRARIYLKKLPFELAARHGLYRFRVNGTGGILFDQVLVPPTQARIFALRASASLPKDMALTGAEIGAAVGLGKSQVNSMLAACVSEGLVCTIGRGRGTRYRFLAA